MLADNCRNQFYDSILAENVGNKHCIEIGFGTGLLSFLALKYQPKHITAFEANYEIYNLGCYLIDKIGVNNKITLINEKFDKTKICKEHDLIFHEILGDNLWDEGVHNCLNYDIPTIPNTYSCNWYIVEISSEGKNHFLESNEMPDWRNEYTKLKGDNWPSIESIKYFDNLPYWVRNEYYKMLGNTVLIDNPPITRFNPGVEIDNIYISEIQELFNNFTDNQSQKIPTISNISKSEYISLISKGFNFFSYEINLSKKNLIMSYKKEFSEHQTIVYDNYFAYNEKFIDIHVDKGLFKNKTCMIIPQYYIGHNNHRLFISPTMDQLSHWLAPKHLAILDGIDHDIYIRQYFDTGKINYLRERPHDLSIMYQPKD
jgi:hypothetical protein